MSPVAKADAPRQATLRFATSLKKTIEIIKTLTADACNSTLTVYSVDLNDTWAEYVKSYTEYEKLIAGKDEEELSKIADEYATLHAAMVKARIHIGKLLTATGGDRNASMMDTSISMTSGVKTVKLPPCKLSPFSGDLREWVEFKATCRSMLTDQISDVHKLQFLKDALKGEPRELVSHVLPAEGAYEKAMLLLKSRYENSRAIVYEHLRKLYILPKNEPNGESIDTLRLIVNTLNGLTAALNLCEVDTSTWDVILIYNTSQCLHPDSLKSWEEKLGGSRAIPTLKRYLEFIETRITILESTDTFVIRSKPTNQHQKASPQHNDKRVRVHFTLKTEYKCVICQRNHVPSRCDELARMPVKDRRPVVQRNGLCFNCLQSHLVVNCPFNPACRKCNEAHHTLLHIEPIERAHLTQDAAVEFNDAASVADNLTEITYSHFYHVKAKSIVMLATALVPVLWNGRSILLNALIDQGATTNLISEHACQMLQLPHMRSNIAMTGVGNAPVGHVTGKTISKIGSIHDDMFEYDISALIVPKVTDLPPSNCDERKRWKHLHGLSLADPAFTRTRKIDLLLGAGVYAEILLDGVKKGNVGEPIAQRTKLGWIVFGPSELDTEFVNFCHTAQIQTNQQSSIDLSQALQQFWALEEVESKKHLTRNEQAAEDSFVKSLTRCNDGKFMVDLPFKVDPDSNCLGNSREQAERRLRSSQRRFSKHPEVKRLYDQNLAEYLTLNHMKELEAHETPRNFLPHHPVVKESSSTTKVRTVFDASARTTNGKSLNDILYVGPTIQPELFDLLMQWRKFQFAICGDIEKMYRQVWVKPEHALFQCILWQPPESNEIKTYKLLTVTFGTASAPFQAIRAVDEVGIRAQNTDPELSHAIRSQFYVDDYLGSGETIESTTSLRQRITEELSKYGFNLRKWKANDSRILEDLPNADKEEMVNFETTFKTLGIAWQPSTDTFQFRSTQPKQVEKWTKRSILSEIAKLYDPLGWLSPCVVKAKMVMQDIWKLAQSHDWDTPVPDYIANEWQTVYTQLCLPIPIRVPRWIGFASDVIHVEIHGFCDAANKAYAAAVYITIHHRDETRTSNLLASKTKLAPIKTISIPRLELCGAGLLTKLIKRCTNALSLPEFKTHAWTDSMITLAWIMGCPSRWTTFVANRVSHIQQALPSNNWRHVPTKQNPADVASRGALVHDLATSELWWKGPEFLLNESQWPINRIQLNEEEIPERRRAVTALLITEIQPNDVLNRFSSYTRLLRFTVYAMRWRNRSRNRIAPIKSSELFAALQKWVVIVQSEAFAQDINEIRHSNSPRSTVLMQLCPFIDQAGVLRMNGRVGNADMLEQKTAIILPANHHFTTLLIRHTHEELLHGGVQITMQKLRERFWIVQGRNRVKQLIFKCVQCFRYKKRLMKQKMADLPSYRIEQNRPFAHVGCDFAGFFEIKASARRNAPISKGYIALFICLTTKAIHLELVPDLSTAEFVMTFENFIARRGIPSVLYTDNGTNFIGAAKEIGRLFQQMIQQNNALTQLFALKNIEFKNIPARASHMGGIWERAVGSVKYHLRRVLKDTKLNARQFDHVLKQIEACLNSRPLWTVTNDVNDIEVLTPSHFFNFQAINTLPRPDVSHIPLNRLDQYQYLYQLYCSFWKAWSKEYLHQFQIRPKWQKEHPNAVIGQVVLIAEDNLPPSRWALGRITAIHPGNDGLIRSVEVINGKTTLRRPIHKLALLPTPDNEELELLEKAQRGENVVTTE